MSDATRLGRLPDARLTQAVASLRSDLDELKGRQIISDDNLAFYETKNAGTYDITTPQKTVTGNNIFLITFTAASVTNLIALLQYELYHDAVDSSHIQYAQWETPLQVYTVSADTDPSVTNIAKWTMQVFYATVPVTPFIKLAVIANDTGTLTWQQIA